MTHSGLSQQIHRYIGSSTTRIKSFQQHLEVYETDIEYGRCAAKGIALVWDTDTTRLILTDIAGFHTNLCQDISADIFRRLPDDLRDARCLSSSREASEKGQGGKAELLTAFNRRYILQPLFKAVFIVLDQILGPTEVRTGWTEGLSVPMSFDAIHRDGPVLRGLINSDGAIDSDLADRSVSS